MWGINHPNFFSYFLFFLNNKYLLLFFVTRVCCAFIDTRSQFNIVVSFHRLPEFRSLIFFSLKDSYSQNRERQLSSLKLCSLCCVIHSLKRNKSHHNMKIHKGGLSLPHGSLETFPLRTLTEVWAAIPNSRLYQRKLEPQTNAVRDDDERMKSWGNTDNSSLVLLPPLNEDRREKSYPWKFGWEKKSERRREKERERWLWRRWWPGRRRGRCPPRERTRRRRRSWKRRSRESAAKVILFW